MMVDHHAECHTVGKLEVITEGTMNTSVTVDQGQVLEWLPIEIGLDVLSDESTIILQETAYQHKRVKR